MMIVDGCCVSQVQSERALIGIVQDRGLSFVSIPRGGVVVPRLSAIARALASGQVSVLF